MTEQVDNVRKARGHIQFAYSRILGRFGPESDVIEALVDALGLLKGLSDEDIKPKVDVAPPKPKRTTTRRTRKSAR